MSYPRRRLRRFLLQGLCLPAVFGDPCVPDKIERLATAISIQEGWNNPDSLVRRQHNPGALIFVGQRGGRKGRSGYALFKTDQAGKDALIADLRAKSARGMTLGRIMSRWSVKSYAHLMVRETGININDVLSNKHDDVCVRRDIQAASRSPLPEVRLQPVSLRAAGFQFLSRAANPFASPQAAF
jgi:hypothetical protein